MWSILLAPPVIGLLWFANAYHIVNKIELDGHPKANNLLPLEPKQLETMREVSKVIQDGAMTFLRAECKVMAVFIVLFTGLLLGLTNVSTAGAFVAGAVTSIACGWIGMSIAVKTNVKTTHGSYTSLGGGSLMPLTVAV